MTDNVAEQSYHVVVNHEEQYSIWPVEQELPEGWRTEGMTGTEAECLAHIDVVWTDMRPLSLRKYMEEHADDGPSLDELIEDDGPSLVDRLCEGEHPVEASLRPTADLEAFRAAVESGYVFVRFTETQGGTELGIRLDGGSDATAELAAGLATVTLSGTLVLDFEPVRCVARIDQATLRGTGRLERVDAS